MSAPERAGRVGRVGRVGRLGLAAVLAGCAGAAPPGTTTPSAVHTTALGTSTPTPTRTPTAAPTPDPAFPTAAFARIREEPIAADTAARLQAVLRETAGTAGVTAAVMTGDGTWSGAAGMADAVRPMRPDDQLAIGSVTKSVIATQVMQLVEAGEVELDDPASDHLPADLDFDTNDATIRQLLGMRSGIPDYVDATWSSLATDRKRRWTTADALALVPAGRDPVGVVYRYSSTNYLLLGLIIERVRGRPVADVLRDGVLKGDGLDRLILQPDEAPTDPMAMPGAGSRAELQRGGGYLPSLAGATAAGAAGGMASDSASLARWWSRLCRGEVVSRASLTEMTTVTGGDNYGLGVSDESERHGTAAVAHGGIHIGYAAWAACFLDDGSVVVTLTNRVADPADGGGDLGVASRVADALAVAARPDP